MTDLALLRVKLFADTADAGCIAKLAADPFIRGFTTNPSLMRQAEVTDYRAECERIVAAADGRPVSLEVLADTGQGMEAQARQLAALGANVYVKIPVTTPSGDSTAATVTRLHAAGVQVNVTAVMTVSQASVMADCVDGGAPAIISVFAGRIADTGRDPVPMVAAVARFACPPNVEILWASTREVFNIVQAEQADAHIVTVGPDLLAKLTLLGRDLAGYSLDTVRGFHADAAAAGFQL